MVGLFAQSHLMRRRRPLGRQGLALASALLAMTAISVLVVGLWTIAALNARAASNRRSALRAQQLAEAAAAHTLAVMRGALDTLSMTGFLLGSDGLPNTSDDGLLEGFGLPVDDQLPATGRTLGGGTYFAQLLDDPADGDADPLSDSNFRILARCRGVTTDGASVSIDVVIGARTLPAIVTDGTLMINGNPDILGACGSIHANDIVVVSGNPTVSGTVSASNEVQVSGSIRDENNQPVIPLSNQPPIQIPAMNPLDYCGDADYILSDDGTFFVVATSQTFDAEVNEVLGWRMVSDNPVKWDVSGNSMGAGTYCVTGNVVVSGNPDGPGNTPLPVTILATGSVQFSGNPTVTPAHPDGLLVISGGDVSISGNPSAFDNYDGLIYARSQCRVSGNPSLGGQLLCDDEPDLLPQNENYVDENMINGNPSIQYDCGGAQGGRRILAWYQRYGS